MMNRRQRTAGLFMLVFLACAVLLAGAAAGQARREIPVRNAADIVTGKWTSSYEDKFNKKIPIYEFSKDAWGLLNYTAFGEGSEGVLVGQDGWLFTKEEFEYQPGMEQEIEKNLSFIRTARDRLAARGARLLVVPVPAKARIYRSKLGEYDFPSYKQGIYSFFLKDLARAGIPAIDLFPPMREKADTNQLFLRTDTHWTTDGARLAAENTALYVRKNMPDLRFERTDYRTITREETGFRGDLTKYIPVGRLASYIGPEPESRKVAETVKTGPAADRAEALFDENAPPITLVGTSYSANKGWNFQGYLEENLQADILNVAEEGVGPFETMEKYLQNAAFRQTPPRLVIWEIPERYLSITNAGDGKTSAL